MKKSPPCNNKNFIHRISSSVILDKNCEFKNVTVASYARFENSPPSGTRIRNHIVKNV